MAAPRYVVTQLTSKQMWALHQRSPASIYAYYYGRYEHKMRAEGGPVYDAAWYRRMRERAHGVIARHVRLKPHVRRKVTAAWARIRGNATRVLGVHVRGTDKEVIVGGGIVPPAVYLPHIRHYLRRHGEGTRVFVATDSPSFLATLRAELGGERVVKAYDAVRSESNIFLDEHSASTGYRKGEDVLVDALLLARCDFLLRAQSAVAEFAIYFNPKLIENSRDLQLRLPPDDKASERR